MSHMHPRSIFAIRDWKLPEILLVGSACFAIGAIGFFLAVFLQLRTSGGNLPGTYTNAQDVPVDDKARALSILSRSAPEPAKSTNTIPNSTQASPDDALASQKLKLLQQMHSK